MARKKKHSPRPQQPRSIPALSRPVLHTLEAADALIEDGDLPAARDLLEAVASQRPRDPNVLASLVDVYFDLQDLHGYQYAAERLLRVAPDDPELMLGLAGAYLTNIYPVLALRTFRRVLERWPDHDRAGEIREQIEVIETLLPEMLADLGAAGAEGLDLATQHEEVRAQLETGSLTEGRRAAEHLLHRWPDFVPALNNLSQIHALEGHYDAAIATAQRSLALDAANVQALSNLTRYYLFSGRLAEARHWADRLKAVDAPHEDDALKIAEALSYLGDDQGVLAAFGAEMRLRPPADSDLTSPFLYHLAAVAHLRLGQEGEARDLWALAQDLAPGLEDVQDNLDDLDRPVDERHGPWPFPFSNWVTHQAIVDLKGLVEGPARRDDDEGTRRGTRRFLRQHPELTTLVPLMLDHGDEDAREFALRMATLGDTPELLAALRDFALGQRGPTAMRQEAARTARAGGALPAGLTRIWAEGEWRDVLFLDFEIHEEPQHRHPPQVEEWHAEALEAQNKGDGKRSEELLQQALAVEPDDPSLLNNLAAAYVAQGRTADAAAIIRRLWDEHPDYYFARIGMARLAVVERQLERAHELLRPLLEQQRFHISEFDGLCAAYAELHFAEGNRDAARSWVDLWESVHPDHPGVAHWRTTLAQPGWLHRLFSRPDIRPTA